MCSYTCSGMNGPGNAQSIWCPEMPSHAYCFLRGMLCSSMLSRSTLMRSASCLMTTRHVAVEIWSSSLKWETVAGPKIPCKLYSFSMFFFPFIDDFPIKTSIYKGFSTAMLNNQRINAGFSKWSKLSYSACSALGRCWISQCAAGDSVAGLIL